MNLTDNLKLKGWTKKEVDKALDIFGRANEKKSNRLRFLEKELYWSALGIAIAGNFIISLVLIPILLTLNKLKLYIVIITLGISFGLLFELLIRSIWNLKKHHHQGISYFIPAVAIINIFIITLYTNDLNTRLLFNNSHNPFVVSLVYAFFFILPYLFYQVVLKEI